MAGRATRIAVKDNPAPSAAVAIPTLVSATGLTAEPWAIDGTLLLSRVGRLWEQALENLGRDHGLIPAEMRVMSVLLAFPAGEASVGELGRHVAVSAGGVTKAVVRLEALGFVSKQICAADRRVVIVAVTEFGRTRSSEAFQAVVAYFSELFGSADGDQREAISTALSFLSARLRPSRQ